MKSLLVMKLGSSFMIHLLLLNRKYGFQNKETPISVGRKSISDAKILTSVFFSRQGVVNTSYLKSKEKASSEWYMNSVPTPLTTNWLKTHPKTGLSKIKINHDNAPIHKSRAVNLYLSERTIKLLEHTPCSPDLAPCDFWLFRKIKKQLKTRKYKNIFELKMTFEEMIRKLEKKDFEKSFNSWIKRCKQVILNNGNYY